MASTIPLPGKGTPSTDGDLSKDQYSPYGEPFELAQRVAITSGDATERLEVLIPPYSQVLSVQIKNATAVGFATGTSATGTPVAAGLVISTGTSLTTSILSTATGTSFAAIVALGSTTTTDNAVNITPTGLGLMYSNGTNTSDVRTNAINLTSSWAYAYLVPVNNHTATNQNRTFIASGGFTFSGDQSHDVVLRGVYWQPTAD